MSADPNDLLTIRQVAQRFNVTLRTLRFYEEKGLISPIRQGRHRLYGSDQIKRLDLIQFGKQCGLQIADLERYLFIRLSGLSVEEQQRQTRHLFNQHRQNLALELTKIEAQVTATEAFVRQLAEG